MNRIVGEAREYDELVAALRTRIAELQTTHASVDDISGLQSGYTGKLLGPAAVRGFGRTSLGPILGALGLKILVAEDETGARITSRLKRRERTAVYAKPPSIAARVLDETGKTRRSALSELKTELMRTLGRRGGVVSAANMTANQRRERAATTARARWLKKRNARVD